MLLGLGLQLLEGIRLQDLPGIEGVLEGLGVSGFRCLGA